MADKKFSQFPESVTLTGSEEFVGLQSSINVKSNLSSKLLPYFNENIIITEAQVTGLISDLDAKLNLSGGTMTGALALNADPTTNLEAATKQYVDSLVVTGEYLKVSQNLADVNDIITSAKNIGVSNGYVIYNDNANHIISNPIPEVIGLGNTTTQTFKLPAKSSLNVNTFGRLYFINNYESADQNFQDSDGNPIFTIKAHTNYIFVLPDSISSNYYVFPIVSFVNGNSGNVTVDLQSTYDNSVSKQIKLDGILGLSILSSLGLELFNISDDQVTCFEPFIVSYSGTSTDAILFLQTNDILSTIFEISSTNFGSIPFPKMTDTQKLAINTSGSPTALGVYNLTTDTYDFYDSSPAWQKLLSINHLLEGTNVTLDKTVPGQVTVNCSIVGADLADASYTIYNPGNTGTYQYFPGANVNEYLVADGTKVFNQDGINFSVYVSGGVAPYIAVKYLGSTTESFLAVCNTTLCNVNNTSGLGQPYQFKFAVGPDTSGTGWSPIANSASPLYLQPNSSASGTPVPSLYGTTNMLAKITLNPGDTIYVVGSSDIGNASNNQVVMPYQSFAIFNLNQALLGSSSGEDLQAAFNNGDGTITTAPTKPFQIKDDLGNIIFSSDAYSSGEWTPTFSALSGISGSISLISARYTRVNNIVTFTQDISFTASSSLIEFSSDLPIASTFNDISQVSLMGQSLTTSFPNAADGALISAIADTTNHVASMTANVSVGSGSKFIQYSVMYKVV